MTRRTWRDLAANSTSRNAGEAVGAAPENSATSIHQRLREQQAVSAMAPDTKLGQLMAEREQLESRLRGLSGAGGPVVDPAIAARFPVASTAERRAEEAAWQQRRARQLENQSAPTPASLANRPAGASNDPLRTMAGMADTPLAQRMGAGLPDFGGGSSGLGRRATNLRNRVRLPDMPRDARVDRGLDTLDQVGRPLRQLGDSVNNAREQLDDLDKKLAEKDISQKDRDEIRKTLKGDELDKVGAKMDKANSVMGAPRKLTNGLEQGWNRKRDRIEAPMDRLSSYARRREERLGTDTGGSGDLFKRMQANRMAALRRKQEERRQEERDQRRRERAAENRREKQREEESMDR